MADTEMREFDRRFVVSILDGELVQEKHGDRERFRYLMFDGLVHLGRNICKQPLRERLECVSRFVQCN
jgi:ATP-dependent DNA ligase